jgi:hypothetical protein
MKGVKQYTCEENINLDQQSEVYKYQTVAKLRLHCCGTNKGTQYASYMHNMHLTKGVHQVQ